MHNWALKHCDDMLAWAKQVQSFVGMVQYFALYIPMMAQWRARLTSLTKKDAPFIFTQGQVEVVEQLKTLLKAAVAYVVDRAKEFYLLTDASETAVKPV